ncbi:hypothetical protein HKX48_002060 [Thoreauomyces humboldtii]|nr:hypothetical protein HKX48_002060 [Thoreauomyces humboldtii]
MQFLTNIRANPPLVFLAAAVSCGLGAGVFMGTHILRSDPTVLVSKNTRRNDPYPWLKVGPERNLKLYAVNQKFEQRKD